MSWVAPLYSRSAIDRAGFALAEGAVGIPRDSALAVVSNWRSAHAFPLNTIQMGLRRKVGAVDADATVAQRIKRLPSITGKIQLNPTMRLSRMQDIGGCRAVLENPESVRSVLQSYRVGNGKHSLARLDDYMDIAPKTTGYRGVHLVYSYRSDRTDTYNGLKIEIQLRTRLQHAWATAVETVGFFTTQALKSNQGAAEWLRFFALMSTEIANVEGTSPVPGTPTNRDELRRDIRALAKRLGVIERLTSYGQTLKLAEEHVAGSGGKYFVMFLNAASGELTVFTFPRLAQATGHYDALEREQSHDEEVDVVLVSVDSMAALRRAYPNYFLDSEAFVSLVRDAVER